MLTHSLFACNDGVRIRFHPLRRHLRLQTLLRPRHLPDFRPCSLRISLYVLRYSQSRRSWLRLFRAFWLLVELREPNSSALRESTQHCCCYCCCYCWRCCYCCHQIAKWKLCIRISWRRPWPCKCPGLPRWSSCESPTCECCQRTGIRFHFLLLSAKMLRKNHYPKEFFESHTKYLRKFK